MRVALFGASGAIGRVILDTALRAGHDVVAFTRDASRVPPRPHVTVSEGDAADAAAVERTIAQAEAVINALGPASNTAREVDASDLSMHNILAAMDRAGVRRLVSLSGAAVDVPGERKPVSGRLVSSAVRALARHVVAAKQREFDTLAASGVDWTAVRPPRVVDAAPTGYLAGDRLDGRTVTRADLAAFMVDQLQDDRYIRQAPYVSSRS